MAVIKHSKRLTNVEKVITDALSIDPAALYTNGTRGEYTTDAVVERVVYIKDAFVEIHRIIKKTLDASDIPESNRRTLDEALLTLESLTMAAIGQGLAGSMLIEETKAVTKIIETDGRFGVSDVTTFRTTLDKFALTLLTYHAGVRDGALEWDPNMLNKLYYLAVPMITLGNSVAGVLVGLKAARESDYHSDGRKYIKERPSCAQVLNAIQAGLTYSEASDMLERFENDLDWYEKSYTAPTQADTEPMSTLQLGQEED